MGRLVHHKVTSVPSIKFTSTHLPTFLKKGTMREKHLNINRLHQVQRLNAHNWRRQLLTSIDLIGILVIGLQLLWNGGSCGGMLLKRDEISFTFERTPSISLNCKIVPFQYREYEYGLLKRHSSCYIRTAVLYLTNIFHVAVRLFSNRLQITSKCGKNKKVAHEVIRECVTSALTRFWHPLWSITEETDICSRSLPISKCLVPYLVLFFCLKGREG